MTPSTSIMKWNIFLILILLNLGCKGQKTQDNGKIEMVAITCADGKIYTGESGFINVPENRDSSISKRIELPFFRIRTSHPNPLPAIFVFEGGPGDNPSMLQQLEDLLPLLYSFSKRSDVIVVEQRGNGRSKPNLTCPGFLELPLDVELTKEGFSRVYRTFMKNCALYWQDQGRELSGYNVLEMADDIDTVRNLLGYEKIMLFGGSFGSHHALTYLQLYPDRVERILLDSAEGLGHTMKLPLDADSMLQQLSKWAAQDTTISKSLPSFIGLTKRIIRKLGKEPVKTKTLHPVTNKEVSIVLGAYDLQLVTALELGRIGYRELPYHYLQMQKGDFSWLASYAIQIRVGQSRNLMAVLTDCASGASGERRKMVLEQSKMAILGDALNNINFKACGLLPSRNVNFTLTADFKSSVSLLIVNGNQDVRTPLTNAKEILEHFENGRILEVKYGSHDLFREGFDILAPVLIGYVTSDDPLSFKLPVKLEVPLNLRLN